LAKGGKISGQGGRAFQSVNNFFNPRTAGAQKHPQRERISTHHFQGSGEIQSPHGGHHHPMSPGGGIGSASGHGNSNSRVGGNSLSNESPQGGPQNGSIFLKNTFSPRMKIGQPPGSSASQNNSISNSGGHNSQNNNFNLGSIGGPVKAAHHTRPGMGRGPARTLQNGQGTG
jgi:hypothetical protein